MESITNNNNILIDLDALFDTRLPTLFAIDRESASKVHESDYYSNRKKDSFGDIGFSIFNAMYRFRNKTILRLATPTEMFDLLNEYCTEVFSKNTSEGMNDPTVTIYLNIFPYVLNASEQATLSNLLNNVIVANNVVKTVSMDISELTPDWISNHVSTVIKYDALNYVEYHMATNALISTPLLSTTLIGPNLYLGDSVTKDDTGKGTEVMMGIAGAFINLQLIKIKYFNTPLEN